MRIGLCACAAVIFLQMAAAHAWNATGHRLIAQIAYHHLKPHAKKLFNHYNHALDNEYRPQSFVNSAAWLDALKYQEFNWFNQLHFIKGYFSLDNSPLPPEPTHNAVWAIQEAMRVLSSPRAGKFHKGIALRILTHVVGDIHQPLHTATKVSSRLPSGDLGGNLFNLASNPIASNLHSYWDNGGGYLTSKEGYRRQYVVKQAIMIEKKWPCDLLKTNLNPAEWVNESHDLAIRFAYQLQEGDSPSMGYQKKVQDISEQRIALAGCRLAAILNQLSQKIQSKN
ncbi:S1/P1 nuclease [Legionella londiniensis]